MRFVFFIYNDTTGQLVYKHYKMWCFALIEENMRLTRLLGEIVGMPPKTVGKMNPQLKSKIKLYVILNFILATGYS